MKVRRIVSTLAESVAEAPLAELDYGKSVQRPEVAYAILRPLLEHEPQEVFCMLLLNAKSRVSGYVEVSRGTLSASLVHPREVFGPAIRMGAASIVIAHNHPSGDPEPSAEDIALTGRLVLAGELLGIAMVDHLVIGEGTFVSLRARGCIK